MQETKTKYFVFNDAEEKEVEHRGGVNLESGQGALFLPIGAELTDEGTLESYEGKEAFIFENLDKDGAFVNNDVVQLDISGVWDIRKEEVPVETPKVEGGEDAVNPEA